MKPRKYSIKKYNGDDTGSYAVFYAEDVRGKRSPIFMGEATPIASGMGRTEATHFKKQLGKKEC
jgi:hypothetical protein